VIKIRQKGDPVLSSDAKEVKRTMFGSPKLLKIVSDMKDALASQEDGVALAAPQIGIPYRIFVISPRVLDLITVINANKNIEKNGPREHKPYNWPTIFINPEITNASKRRRLADEGCLSLRNYYGKVKRFEKISIEAFDEQGRRFRRGGSGLLAQIYQHEVDHLNGILFDQKAEEFYYIPAEKRKISSPNKQ